MTIPFLLRAGAGAASIDVQPVCRRRPDATSTSPSTPAPGRPRSIRASPARSRPSARAAAGSATAPTSRSSSAAGVGVPADALRGRQVQRAGRCGRRRPGDRARVRQPGRHQRRRARRRRRRRQHGDRRPPRRQHRPARRPRTPRPRSCARAADANGSSARPKSSMVAKRCFGSTFIARSMTSSISCGISGRYLARALRRAADDPLEDDEQVLAVVGALPRQALIKNDAERVLIAGRARGLAVHDLLGREVVRRSDHRRRCWSASRACVDRVVALRDAEVEHLGERRARVPAARKMFCGLRSRWVMPASCAAATAEQTGSMMSASSSAPIGPSRSSRCARSSPWQELHHQVGVAAVAAHVGDVDDVRVADARRQLRLAQEARARAGHRGDQRAQHLDRDLLLISVCVAS